MTRTSFGQEPGSSNQNVEMRRKYRKNPLPHRRDDSICGVLLSSTDAEIVKEYHREQHSGMGWVVNCVCQEMMLS